MTSVCRSAKWKIALLVVAVACAADARGGSELARVQVHEFPIRSEVIFDVGDLIASGAVQPVSAISIDKREEGSWLLRTPRGPEDLRWYRNLLNVSPGAPDLVIDPKLKGVYDIYAQVRAVDLGGVADKEAKPAAALPMVFALKLDDGSKRELAGAKGFPGYHYDTEVLACHNWRMDGRKLVLRSLGKPIYLYGFRFVPSAATDPGTPERTVTRWLAGDHVTITREDDKNDGG